MNNIEESCDFALTRTYTLYDTVYRNFIKMNLFIKFYLNFSFL
ncbi:hypothetical protein HMPREF9193_02181 [Treponema lecithinolyticum ATCC 700332]|uniref:Uncharacterized protein n=1 Tax=Treponema lecithinolyticum ATCC 700332 TaxID=1321815 RepID=A0ABN0NVV5_TRELE|nr:hypothetical protein HMPREF9193_02181 [Treponema lecithinolyticum ATCC 700332]